MTTTTTTTSTDAADDAVPLAMPALTVMRTTDYISRFFVRQGGRGGVGYTTFAAAATARKEGEPILDRLHRLVDPLLFDGFDQVLKGLHPCYLVRCSFYATQEDDDDTTTNLSMLVLAARRVADVFGSDITMAQKQILGCLGTRKQMEQPEVLWWQLEILRPFLQGPEKASKIKAYDRVVADYLVSVEQGRGDGDSAVRSLVGFVLLYMIDRLRQKELHFVPATDTDNPTPGFGADNTPAYTHIAWAAQYLALWLQQNDRLRTAGLIGVDRMTYQTKILPMYNALMASIQQSSTDLLEIGYLEAIEKALAVCAAYRSMFSIVP